MIEDENIQSSGSQSALRRANERNVIEALRALGPSSQASLARSVGLSRSAVNAIVRSLAEHGVVEVRTGATSRETSVVLGGARGAIVAIDLGHQRLHGSVVSFDNRSRIDRVVDIDREHDPVSDVSILTMLVDQLLDEAGLDRSEVSQLYVALHAPYDRLSRSIPLAGILPGWEGFDIEAELSERLGMPLVVDNDANFAALAEWSWGAARGTRDLLYVKFSHGIGSGLILQGEVFRGTNGMAGEIGHIVVDERGSLCNCGNRGCLSAVASGRALLQELSVAGTPRESLQDLIAGARGGDLACRRILVESGRYLGRSLAHAVKMIAPATIIIGGELAAAGSYVFDSVAQELAASSLPAPSTLPQISHGILRADMAILGCVAASLAARSAGFGELPTWLLSPTGHRAKEYA